MKIYLFFESKIIVDEFEFELIIWMKRDINDGVKFWERWKKMSLKVMSRGVIFFNGNYILLNIYFVLIIKYFILLL